MTREIAHQKSFEKALYAIEPVHNLILSTSSCISRSLVRSYSLVVRGLSCAAISCACSSAPPLAR
jgi:hypothetical protein